MKSKLVRYLSRISNIVPIGLRPVLRPFSGVYSHVYKAIYSSIKEEGPVKTPFGPLIYVNYRDYVEREIANGNYESEYIDLFCRKVKECDVVVDIGAYVGIFSLLASERVGDKGYVCAFEPLPRNYERLIRNIEVNKRKNIRTYNFGLSDKNETLFAYMPKEIPAEASLSKSSYTEITKRAKLNKDVVEVKLTKLDQFCKDEALAKINIAKIDVEGAELKVLKGAKISLKNPDLTLFLELHPPLIKQVGGSVTELVRLLIECGFKIAYSIKSTIKMNLAKLGEADIEKFFGNKSDQYILEKSS